MGGALVVADVGRSFGEAAWIGDPVDDSAALVRRAQHGDREAFAALIHSHDDEVRRVAQQIVRDSSDAEDLTQEVWLRIAEKIVQVSEPDRFRGWVRSVARSVSLNFLRRKRTKERAMGTRESSADALPRSAADDESSSPEDHVLRRDEQRRVWEALGALSEQDRTVLRLREVEDRAYEDIATLLGTSTHAAEVRNARARDRLRRQISVVDQTPVSCNANPLLLRALIEQRSRDGGGPLDDHVASCPTCQRRLASMNTGRSALSGLAGIVLLPRGLMATLDHIRAAISRGYASVDVPHLVARAGAAVPAAPAFDGGAPLLGGAGSVAAAATLLSIAMGVGAVPADAHDANAVTQAVHLIAASTNAGVDAIGARLAEADIAIATPPIQQEPAPVLASAGDPSPSAPVASTAPTSGEPRPAQPQSPTPPPASAPPASPASGPLAPPASSPPASAVSSPQKSSPATSPDFSASAKPKSSPLPHADLPTPARALALTVDDHSQAPATQNEHPAQSRSNASASQHDAPASAPARDSRRDQTPAAEPPASASARTPHADAAARPALVISNGADGSTDDLGNDCDTDAAAAAERRTSTIGHVAADAKQRDTGLGDDASSPGQWAVDAGASAVASDVAASSVAAEHHKGGAAPSARKP